MKKKLIILSVLLLMILGVVGCSNSKKEEEPEVEIDLSLSEDLVLANEFFGLELTVPKGWYLMSINDTALSSDGTGTSEEPYSESVSEEGIVYLDLVSFTSTLDPEVDTEYEVTIFAEKMDVSIDIYKDTVKNTMSLDTNGLPFTFTSEEAYVVGDVTYSLSHFVTETDEGVICIDYYLHEVRGYFFNVAFIYWQTDADAYSFVADDLMAKIVWND